MATGIVYLIGAGPGDPELITAKGLRLLRKCDVVLYDSLIPSELVVWLPAHVERTYVGKRGGRPSMTQDEINQRMLELALSGKRVGRLKGSDPLVFGRGGEEAVFLKKHGVPFEIVPGITAGIAAPAYCGIPITDRSRASYVVLATGHGAGEKSEPSVPWDKLAQLDGGTIVIYMGVGEIGKIATALLASDMSSDTPAAAIERGTYPTQRTVISTLGAIASDMADQQVKAPAIIVIGSVVDLRQTLDWFGGKPLSGIRVLVTRAADQAAETYTTLRDLGAEVLAYPTIATKPSGGGTCWQAFEQVLESGGWLVFASENGVRYFMQAFSERFGDIRRIHRVKLATVGEGTARALASWHLTSDFTPSNATVMCLASDLVSKHDMRGKHVIRIRGILGDDSLEQKVSEAGALVEPLIVYETMHVRWSDDMRDRLIEYPPDAILFTSSSTFDGFAANLSHDELSLLFNRASIFSIGPSTSATVRAAGYSVAVESDTHSIPALIDAVVHHYSTR